MSVLAPFKLPRVLVRNDEKEIPMNTKTEAMELMLAAPPLHREIEEYAMAAHSTLEKELVRALNEARQLAEATAIEAYALGAISRGAPATANVAESVARDDQLIRMIAGLAQARLIAQRLDR